MGPTVYIKNFRFLTKLNYSRMGLGTYYDFEGLNADLRVQSTLHLYTNGETLYRDSMEWANILHNMGVVSKINEIYIVRPCDGKQRKPYGEINYQSYENAYIFGKYLP